MTLTMTIVAPWGVWQCADHRLIWIDGGKVTDREDFSVKHMAVRCPDGVALITYSGIGALDRKLHVSDWMRELVRGDNRRTVDGTLIRIREAATMDLARPGKAHGVVHWFVAGVFLQRGQAREAVTAPGTELVLNPSEGLFYNDDIVQTAEAAGAEPAVALGGR